MTLELWLIYLAASIGLSLTPGPNGLLSLTSGVCYGLRATLFTVLGGAIGFLLLIGLSIAGFGVLLTASEQAFTIAKLIGAAYLIYLGVRIWRSRTPVLGSATMRGNRADANRFRLFRQGFLVAVSNPKGLLFFAAFLPQFMVPGVSFLTHLFVLGGTFVIIEIVYELLLAGLAQRISPFIVRYGRWFNRITGGAFIGIGAALTNASR